LKNETKLALPRNQRDTLLHTHIPQEPVINMLERGHVAGAVKTQGGGGEVAVANLKVSIPRSDEELWTEFSAPNEENAVVFSGIQFHFLCRAPLLTFSRAFHSLWAEGTFSRAFHSLWAEGGGLRHLIWSRYESFLKKGLIFQSWS